MNKSHTKILIICSIVIGINLICVGLGKYLFKSLKARGLLAFTRVISIVVGVYFIFFNKHKPKIEEEEEEVEEVEEEEVEEVEEVIEETNRHEECKLDTSLPHCQNIEYLPSMVPEKVCNRCKKHSVSADIANGFKDAEIPNCLDDGTCCLIKNPDDTYFGCPPACFNVYQEDLSKLTQEENRSILKDIKSNTSTCKDL